MKRGAIHAVAVGAMFLLASSAAAQSSSGGQMPMSPGGQQPSPGMPGMMHQGGMMGGMMCPMMGDGMGMGMMAGGTQDPKVTGRLLQIRGEMLRAMGDIMVKHGQAMEQGKTP